jgi:hypothetical protein
MTDPSLDPILAYLREHSGRYSLSALREQLLRNGYTPADVDRAIVIYQREHPPKAPAQVWPKALLVAGGNILLVLLGILGLAESSGRMADLIGFVPLLVVCGEVLGGIVLLFGPQSRIWGRALLFGFLLTLALGLLLGGICIVLAGLINWH